jgi:ketose-bisphosphate aldolase
MARVPFVELMAAAEHGGYAVGYFESWNLESLLAVADAAEAVRAPVILGFSGIYLPHPARAAHDRLAPYAAMAASVADGLAVPACLVFNESPDRNWVIDAIGAGFDLVMFSDEALSAEERTQVVRDMANRAHQRGAAVEGELTPLEGVAGDLSLDPADADTRLTDAEEARTFVEETGVDALAVNVGQLHLHGRKTARLDLDRLSQLRALGVPLVLHGGSSIDPDDLRRAIALGIQKINIGSRLKQAYFNALREAVAVVPEAANPYEVIGSGLKADVLIPGRLAMQREVERLMHLFGSAGRAGQ